MKEQHKSELEKLRSEVKGLRTINFFQLFQNIKIRITSQKKILNTH